MQDVSAEAQFPPLPTNKSELLQRIRSSRSALEQLLGSLSDEELLLPEPSRGWAIKDHLAHIATWEQSLLALLEGRPRHAAMGVDAESYAADEDSLNALIYQGHKDRPLREVMAFFAESHRQVLATLDRMRDADLFKPYSAYQPHDPAGCAAPVIEWIAGDTYEHYLLHATAIRGLRDARRPA